MASLSPSPLRLLKRCSPATVEQTRWHDHQGIPSSVMDKALTIVNAVRDRGIEALKMYAQQWDQWHEQETSLVLDRTQLRHAYETLNEADKAVLHRTAQRIEYFAQAQKNAIHDITVAIAGGGGQAGHTVVPVTTAGCYAPGGNYPLPSSMLMTAITAKVAGVKNIVAAAPHPGIITQAAAYLAGVDVLLQAGGAQAIAALAYGVGVNRADVIVGPGNRFVTAAKKIVSGMVGIDALAGPSELLIIADDTADAAIVAADLLAQAEHDVEARPILVAFSETFVQMVEAEIDKQLGVLPTAPTAAEALKNGFAVIVKSSAEAANIASIIAPEHLEVLTHDADQLGYELSKSADFGGLFIGANAAEVLGDYGAGPNHTLPTMSTARYTGGLSVFNFLRIRTWMRIDSLPSAQQLVHDAVHLARIEGLIGHSRSAEKRLLVSGNSEVTPPIVLNDASTVKNVSASSVLSPKIPSSSAALKHVRADFMNLMEYAPVKPLEVLANEIGMPVEQLAKLNANENLYGPVDDVAASVQQHAFHIYPDPDQHNLRAALKESLIEYNFSSDEIVAGAGSDELLDVLFTLTDPQSIVISTPTFSMYQFFAQLHKAKVIDIPRGDASLWHVNVDATIRATYEHHAKLVFIASPNNPTGNVIPNAQVERLCQEADALIVIDEAYAEFANETALPLLKKYANLIVLRTFSKWAGLAGLRVGFMVAHRDICIRIMQIKQPYNVNVAAEAAAILSLQNKDVIMHGAVRAMLTERERLMVQLGRFAWIKPLPSQANFILCEVDGIAPRLLQKELFKRGVLVRCYAGNSDSNLNKHIRISCGRPQDTDRLLEVLYELQVLHSLSAINSEAAIHHNMLVRLNDAKKCNALLFDMDGVLADVSDSYRLAIIETAKFFGVQVTGADIAAEKHKGDANNDWLLTQRLIRNAGKRVDFEYIKTVFQEFYLGSNGKRGLRDNESLLISKQLLCELAAFTKLAIVTGRPRTEAQYFLKHYGIAEYFSALSCMEDGHAKPHPDPIINVMEQLGLVTRHEISGVTLTTAGRSGICYMVGDTPDDIVASIAASRQLSGNDIVVNVIPIGITTPDDRLLSTVKVLYETGASRVIDNLEQLRSIILKQELSVYSLRPLAPKHVSENTSKSQSQIDFARHGQRCATFSRVTKETSITVTVNLDGKGISSISTGIDFVDHMLNALSKHSKVDIELVCKGDLQVDDHHSTEDCALALGTALAQALGDKKGIQRYGYAYAPLDDSMARAVIDFSGRPYAEVDLQLRREMIGGVSTEMLDHFFRSFATAACATLHVDVIRGVNDHHKSESAFKALALALRQAISLDVMHASDIPSTKGVL